MSLSRFKGALVGAVIGDCIGAIYEGQWTVHMSQVIEATSRLQTLRQEQREKGSRPADVYGLSFTDDTAMARSISASLLQKGGFDAADMAQRFSEEYFKESDRGYGGNIATVFEGLRDPSLKDVYEPARQQFDGSGSYGNGGAMRIVPVPLFVFHENNNDQLQTLVSSVTRLTHSNHLAIHGAILQSQAVDLSLRMSKDEEVDANKFLDALIERLKPLEEEINQSTEEPPMKKIPPKRKLDSSPTPYCAKLNKIREFLRQDDLKAEEVERELGNDVSSLGSVPAAVLSFLKAATNSISELKDRTPFERTVLYSISLGGDTDTIATMAAAMAGARYGMDQIPEAWQYYCEGVAEAERTAEEMWTRGLPSDGTKEKR